jgi:hypothetical protein
MDWAAYFEKVEGIGVLGTAGESGAVDLALYAKPRVMADDVLAFIMRPGLSHQNLRKTTKAAYLFIENGEGYRGHRLYLMKVREEMDPKLIEQMRRTHSSSWHKDSDEAYLLYFRIEGSRPLIGDNPL